MNSPAESARHSLPTPPTWRRNTTTQVAHLCQRIVERARSISEQLTSPQEPVQFEAGGVARLSGWTPRIASQQQGLLRFERVGRDGKKLLHITASQGGGAGSWRTRAVIEAGRYRFEGNARTSGVGAGGGVSLRISGSRDIRVSASDDGWSLLRFDLAVERPLTEVELICELRAAQGEAWFEEESLQLVRE